MAAQVDVSVVVPCYNGERYLDQCLSSIEKNDRVSLQIIAVNDGSRDSSLSIMREHESRDGRYLVIDKQNSGYGASVNAGIEAASGRYIALVECDDFVQPHFYDDLVEYAASFSCAPQIVKTPYTRVVLPDTSQEVRLHCKYFGLVHETAEPFTLAQQPMLVHYHPSIWSAMYEREFLNDKAIRMREVPGAGWVDNPFLIETMCQAERIVYLEREYYCYREDAPGSSSALRNVDVAIDRWMDMQDIVERLDVSDPAILDSHLWHAFAFIAGAVDSSTPSDDGRYQRVVRMFERMEPDRVFANKFVSNDQKAFFAKVRGIEGATWDRGAHGRQIAREVALGLRNDGASFVVAYVNSFLASRKK